MLKKRFHPICILAALVLLGLAGCRPAESLPQESPTPAELATTAPPAAPTGSPPQATDAGPTQVTPTQTGVPTTAPPAAETPPGEPESPEGWQTFNDLTYGFTFAFPPEWEVCQAGQYSYLFCEREAEAGAGPPPALYVSTIPQGFTNQQFEVYNFLPDETIRELLALPVGESLVIPPDAPLAEFFNYERLPDATVGGWTAVVIENDRVWEAPPEVKDRRVLIATEGATYMIGAYYDTPQDLETFENVLSTFRFVPQGG